MCIPTSTCKRNVECKQLLLAKAFIFFPFLSFSSLSISVVPSSLLLFSLSHILSFSQMRPSYTSSTTRRPRTLRSCARLALMASLLPPPPMPADPFLPYLLSRIPTPCPTQTPSPVSKACLSLSPRRLKAGLPPLVSPSLSLSRRLSRPLCGGSCRASGTALSWWSSQMARDDYRR